MPQKTGKISGKQRARGKRRQRGRTVMISPRNGAECPTGADVPGAGGKKGKSGRKTLEFKRECEHLTDAEVLEKVRAYLEGCPRIPSEPAKFAVFKWCAEYVTQYARGKPPTVVRLPTLPPAEPDDDLESLSDEALYAKIREIASSSARRN